MILTGQLPPQFVRIPELNFYNPVFNASAIYILTALLFMAGLMVNNYYSKIQSAKYYCLSDMRRKMRAMNEIFFVLISEKVANFILITHFY